jgi:hypothetical protein
MNGAAIQANRQPLQNDESPALDAGRQRVLTRLRAKAGAALRCAASFEV